MLIQTYIPNKKLVSIIMTDTDLLHDMLDEVAWESGVKAQGVGVSLKDVESLNSQNQRLWNRKGATYAEIELSPMVIPWAATELDCEDIESRIGCHRIYGDHF
jgi:hypothetical protein